jgi:hypothetical protein
VQWIFDWNSIHRDWYRIPPWSGQQIVDNKSAVRKWGSPQNYYTIVWGPGQSCDYVYDLSSDKIMFCVHATSLSMFVMLLLYSSNSKTENSWVIPDGIRVSSIQANLLFH